MTVIVEFTNPKLRDFVMEGPSVDYQIHQGFLIVTADPCTSTPEKRVTFPIREVHAIFEYHNEEYLTRLVFPDDPIRDYVEKKVAEIEERYRWIDAFY